jgi:hypothetical protein
MVLCSLHRLTPLVQRFLCIEIQRKNFFVVLIQGMRIPLPRPLFPVYRFFFPVAVLANFGVRVYVSIVTGGSLTTEIILRHRGIAVLEGY